MTSELFVQTCDAISGIIYDRVLGLSYLYTTFFSPSLLMITASIERDYFCLDGEESHSNIS